MDTFNESLGLKIPGHVAVILDGNGRWAKKRHLPRTMGHVQGSKVVEDMLYVVDELGVKYFTVYAFSTENWKRSTEEVSTLMGILRTYLKDCVKKSMKNNVRCRVIGRKDELSQDIIDSINNLEEKTKNNTGLNFTIAINYGGRDEIRRAAAKLAEEGIDAKVINIHTIKPLDEELVVAAAKETGKVVTVEEHSIIGGLGGAVCECLAETAPVPVKRIGINDVYGESGPAVALLEKYGLDAAGIYKQIKAFI